MTAKLPKFGYARWEDAESWTDCEGETFDEAARFALAEHPEADEVWICDATPVDALALILRDALDAERVIERAEESRESWPEDSAGWYDDKLFDDSVTARLSLEFLLRDAASAWLATFPGATANIWEASNPRRVTRDEVSA